MVHGKFDSRFVFTSDEDARRKMMLYIIENFPDLIGDDQDLLDRPDGLESLQARVKARLMSYEAPLAKAA